MLRTLLEREFGDDEASVAMTELTEVELTHIPGRIERWLRFGEPVRDRIVDRRRRVLEFMPGQVFAFIRWAANDHGTVLSRIDIMRTVEAGQPVTATSMRASRR